MLNNLRYKIATNLAEKSKELIETGDFKSIKKGLKYFKASIRIVPPSKELSEIGKRLRETAEEQRNRLNEDQG